MASIRCISSLKFFFIVLLNIHFSNQTALPLDTLLNELYSKVNEYQVLKEQEYTLPPHWYEKLGLYRSDIRINLFGNVVTQNIRSGKLSAVFDNNMFSTGWIVTALLEAQLYGRGAPQLEKDRLELALRAIGSYNDKNYDNGAHNILRTFWPQSFNNVTGLWQQQPININHVATALNKIPFQQIESLLHKLGLDKLIPFIDGFKYLGGAVSAFCIPPDFDDTYLNFGLGATLSKFSEYDSIYKEWLANNTDVDHLIESTTKYAYKPFDSDLNSNVIDPRTYFFARNFVQEAAKNGQPVSLITTWIQNIDQQRELKDRKVSMPFNLNNVDVTVAANTIYGITSGAIFNTNGFGDKFLQSPELIQTYLNSTRFISWAINGNFSGRPDLAQVYYPSTFNFLWYASRTLFLIESEYQKMQLANKNEYLMNKEHFMRLNNLQNVLSEVRI
jgi:hypothetical protein